ARCESSSGGCVPGVCDSFVSPPSCLRVSCSKHHCKRTRGLGVYRVALLQIFEAEVSEFRDEDLGNSVCDYRVSAGAVVFLYQSIVWRRPSSNGTCARKANFCSARETSSMRRGWPSGFDASHTISPLNPVRRAISCARSLILISAPAPILT